MQFVKPRKSTSGLVTTKGHYLNQKGKTTHHPRKIEKPIEFIGVDGEGMMVGDEHRYVLFGVGDKQIADSAGLSFQRIFEFLYGEFKPEYCYCGFFLGYDFTQIFKTLPENRGWMLLTREGQLLRKHRRNGLPPHPVECDGWQFDLLGNKRLKLRPKECECEVVSCKCKKAPWMYVCDVGSFFQSSFLSVIDPRKWRVPVVSDEEYELIRRGKERRSEAWLDDEMRFYNRLENEILGRVMRTVDHGFRAIGVYLPRDKWFGPGQAAQAWLKNKKVPIRVEVEKSVPVWFLEAARMTYFGGWFEIMMHGKIPGVTHEYDINSAYPSIIANLPCLLHGEYDRGEGDPPDEGYVAAYASVRGRSKYVGAMLHRDKDGRILRPSASEGWYWWHELQAAQRAGLVKTEDVRVDRWVRYRACRCRPPMAAIAGLYEKRLEAGKDSPMGKSAKLVYNSGYGKFAQSVGVPVFGNPVYASLITAGCRTMILDAIATHPKGASHVAMVATDAVYFLTPHKDLKCSDKLGEWDYKERACLTLFKPGVYWDDKARERISQGIAPNFKARGIKSSDLANSIERIDQWFDSWESGNALDTVGRWPLIRFTPTFAMVTGLQALRRRKWETAGMVTGGSSAKEVVQSADPSDKRVGLYRDVVDGRVVWRSKPHDGMRQVESEDGFRMEVIPSVPYEKRFGMEDPFSDEYKEALGVTPDGNLMDVLYWMMGEE